MIVEATVPLVLEHGAGVTTRQIAEAAGIAEGTIFRAFADKEELLDAVVDAVLDPAPFERALAAIAPGLPLDALVTAAVTVSQRRVSDVWRLLTAVGTRAQDRKRPMPDSPTLTALLAAHRGELSVSPAAAARLLRALTFSLSHPMLVERPAAPREIARLYLNGVAGGGR